MKNKIYRSLIYIVFALVLILIFGCSCSKKKDSEQPIDRFERVETEKRSPEKNDPGSTRNGSVHGETDGFVEQIESRDSNLSKSDSERSNQTQMKQSEIESADSNPSKDDPEGSERSDQPKTGHSEYELPMDVIR